MGCAPSFLSSEELDCGAQPGLCDVMRSLGRSGWWLVPATLFLVGGREKQDVIKMTAIPPCQQRVGREERREERRAGVAFVGG